MFMVIKSNASGDDLISFVGKMPEDLINENFNWKKRLCFDLLNDYSEKGLLEIVPKSFTRRGSRIDFLSRYDNGIYLDYSGCSQVRLGLEQFYVENLGYWIPVDSPAEKVLEDFKENILIDFQKKIFVNKLHLPSKEEVDNLSKRKRDYADAMNELCPLVG